MKALAAFLDKIDALTPRERVILFLLLLAGLWAALDGLLLHPMDLAIQAKEKALSAIGERMTLAQNALNQNAVDPTTQAKMRLESARKTLDARMHAHSRLVAARDMVQVLQGLLHTQPGLRLVSLKTLPPEAVGLPAALFRQGVRIRLAGSYENLVHYMEGLEGQPVSFYWGSAELDARHYPEIELSLTLYTLSTEQIWLTV